MKRLLLVAALIFCGAAAPVKQLAKSWAAAAKSEASKLAAIN